MKTLNKILMAALTLSILLVGFAYVLPSTWSVTRSIIIQAPPQAIHPFVEDLRRWPSWVMWANDPTLKYEYFGAPVGVGAGQSWVSDETGSGTLSIKESNAQKGLIYLEQFGIEKSSMHGALRYEALPNGTKVTWTSLGALGQNPISRYLGLLMDYKVGTELEQSLNNLKKIVETHGA
jgi:hypothetical protein